jgi:hypothetical protein
MTMSNVFKFFLLGLLFVLSLSASFADQISKEQIKGLDEQVQDIKKDVLGISAELTQLEEKLIYPSNTQVSVFVSLAKTSKFQLYSMNISIDGKYASHHIYTFKELEALQGGGVQRIYTGNVRVGDHILDISLIGKAGGKDYPQNASHVFSKSVEPKLIEVKLGELSSGSQLIGFND